MSAFSVLVGVPNDGVTHQRCVKLTRLGGWAIFSTMRRANLICRLAGALSLAVMGFLLAAGAAAAHNGYVPSGDLPKASVQTMAPAHQLRSLGVSDVPASPEFSVLASDDSHDAVPCSKDRSAGHASGNCCTVACHAALAAPHLDPVGSLVLPSSRIVGLTGMLAGRSGDRTERPPKLS
jgi:hypothetical protein